MYSPNTGILGIGFSILNFDFIDPFWDSLDGKGYMLILPGVKIKTRKEAVIWVHMFCDIILESPSTQFVFKLDSEH